MFGRILVNTRKHIFRSGWIGWASVFVMTLAFVVASIFGSLAKVADLYIQFYEGQSNVLVFFEVGIDQRIVNRLETKWKTDSRLSSIEYFTEEEAYDFYSNYTANAVPEQYQVLSRFEEKKLPSSLDIKVKSLNQIEEIQKDLQEDIDNELVKLIIINTDDLVEDEEETTTETSEETDDEDADTVNEILEDTSNVEFKEGDIRYKYSSEPNEPPITLVVDSESISAQRDFYFKLRMVGLFILLLLSVFVVIFTFMTTEFRLHNQKEEIGVMQLVGGSLGFIRAPYVLEGGIYGLIGALVTSALWAILLIAVLVVKVDQNLYTYIFKYVGYLPWPQWGIIHWSAIVLLMSAIGFILGAVSSYLSIRRYIR